MVLERLLGYKKYQVARMEGNTQAMATEGLHHSFLSILENEAKFCNGFSVQIWYLYLAQIKFIRRGRFYQIFHIKYHTKTNLSTILSSATFLLTFFFFPYYFTLPLVSWHLKMSHIFFKCLLSWIRLVIYDSSDKKEREKYICFL